MLSPQPNWKLLLILFVLHPHSLGFPWLDLFLGEFWPRVQKSYVVVLVSHNQEICFADRVVRSFHLISVILCIHYLYEAGRVVRSVISTIYNCMARLHPIHI